MEKQISENVKVEVNSYDDIVIMQSVPGPGGDLEHYVELTAAEFEAIGKFIDFLGS